MKPIQKLNSFFIHKKQFEKEIAMCGFRFNDTLKQELKDLKKSNEFDKALISKYIFIRSEEYFSNSIRQLLSDIEFEVNDKVNIVAENDLKSEFLGTNIRKLLDLLEKVEIISKKYPLIDLSKREEKAKLFLNTIKIQNIKESEIIIFDDILNDLASLIKQISLVNKPKSVLYELFDIDNSDIYMSCLYKTSIEVSNIIQRIISENNQILQPKFNISDVSPFLIPIEQIEQESIAIENKSYKTKHYVLTYIIECYAKGEIPPVGEKIKLEKIGNEKMGVGKGNTFYKVFSQIINKDFNIERNLIEIGGDDWRKIIKNLSKEHNKIETYLQSKEL